METFWDMAGVALVIFAGLSGLALLTYAAGRGRASDTATKPDTGKDVR
jgi:hypothetical protein